jgi:hypothetical protein
MECLRAARKEPRQNSGGEDNCLDVASLANANDVQMPILGS